MFSNTDDIIDSRDIIERIEELEELEGAIIDAQDELDELLDMDDEATEEYGDRYQDDLAEREKALDEANEAFSEDEREEIQVLRALADEASGYAADWNHGESLIRDSYFKEFAQQLAEDIGAIDPSATWPLNCIDWEEAAEQLKADYTSVEFDGVTYWIR
jgi:hypothetical protein